MSISPKHSLINKKSRRIGSGEGISNKDVANYNKTEEILELVYVDVCNGVSRRDCQKKLTEGEYGNKPFSVQQARAYYTAVLDQIAQNTDIEHKRLKDVLWSRYEALLETAVKKDDLYNARGILDSMAKIFGLEQKTPTTAIQINGGDEKIVVNFGLSNEGG